MLRELWNRARAPRRSVRVLLRYGISLLPERQPGLWQRLFPRSRNGASWSHDPSVPPLARRRVVRPPGGAAPRAPEDRRMGQRLMTSGLINAEQLTEALMRGRINQRRLGETLVEMQVISWHDVSQVLAWQFGLGVLDLTTTLIDPAIAKLVPAHIAFRHQLIAVNKVGNELTIAITDPLNVLAEDDIQLMTGMRVRRVLATVPQVRQALQETFGVASQLDGVFGDIERDIAAAPALAAPTSDLPDQRELDAPVARLVDLILSQAVQSGATEIRFEPFERELRVRYRRDGRLRVEMTPPRQAYDAIVQRIRVLASLNARPGVQVATFQRRLDAQRATFRAVLSPTRFGTAISLFVSTGARLGLGELGLEPSAARALTDALAGGTGLVVVAGPRRSGRSATLHAIAMTLNTVSTHLQMVDDRPQEPLHGITQVACPPGGYAAALEELAQIAPDALLVGDLPDRRTARRVLSALDAGALVVVRLDCLDAAAVIRRLRGLGSAGRGLVSHVRAVTTQRLVRTLCPGCRRAWTPPPHVLTALGFAPGADTARWARPAGCDACSRTGFRGLTGVFEVLPISPRNRRALARGRSAEAVVGAALDDGARPLRAAALAHVSAGRVSLEDALALEETPPLRAADAIPEPEPLEPRLDAGDPFASLLAPPPLRTADVLAAGMLAVLRGTEVVQTFPIYPGANTIGQRDELANIAPDIDLSSFDRAGLIAPHHVTVFAAENAFWVADEFGSTGARLNDALLPKLARTPLRPGDTLSLAGALTLRLETLPAPQ